MWHHILPGTFRCVLDRLIVTELTCKEVESLRSKILTLETKPGKGRYSKHGHNVFSEKGKYTLVTILKGEQACPDGLSE